MQSLNQNWQAFLLKNRVKYLFSMSEMEKTFLNSILMEKLSANTKIVDTTWVPKKVITINGKINKIEHIFYFNLSDFAFYPKEGIFLYHKDKKCYRPFSETFPHLKEKEFTLNEIFYQFILSLEIDFSKKEI